MADVDAAAEVSKQEETTENSATEAPKDETTSGGDNGGAVENNENLKTDDRPADVNAAATNDNDNASASIETSKETTEITSNDPSVAPQQQQATHTLPGSIAQIPKVIIPPGQTSHSEPCPLIGPGWIQQAVQRTTPTGGTYKNDRIFISPDGRKFKSYTDVLRFLSNAANRNNNYNLIISASANNSNVSSANPSPRPIVPTSGPGSGRGIDMHPYQRGSVIEVLYVKRTKVFKDLNDNFHDDDGNEVGNRRHFWWEDEESLSDWFNSDDENEDDKKNDDKSIIGKDKSDLDKNNNDNVWLCDIIDRAPLYPALDNHHPQQQWKYYIHYRDFNRRMDEWIPMERIVSPPSVGNAKVRALKRKKDEEEKERVRAEMMRERLEREEGEKRMRRLLSEGSSGGGGGNNSDVSTTGRRESSLRSSRSSSVGEALNALDGTNNLGVGTGLIVGGGAGGGDPRKRPFRRSTSTAMVNDAASAAEMDASRPTRRRRGTGNDGDLGTDAGIVSGTSTVTAAGTTKATSSSSGGSAVVVAEEHTAVDVVTTLTAQVLDEHEGMDEAQLKEHEEVTKVKNVAMLELGEYQMDTWYFSPLPKELFQDGGGLIDVLYVDEFSLNFFTRKSELLRYQAKELPKKRRHPPGNEIYRCGNLSMFEVDGFEERQYCQNLCYIAKLFLDHKTLYFDVDPFLFYVLCEVDERGYHPVGYYSKEKYSDVGYNLGKSQDTVKMTIDFFSFSNLFSFG